MEISLCCQSAIKTSESHFVAKTGWVFLKIDAVELIDSMRCFSPSSDAIGYVETTTIVKSYLSEVMAEHQIYGHFQIVESEFHTFAVIVFDVSVFNTP